MNRFRIIVAGCGSMSNRWVEYALTRTDAEIVALVDVIPESARAMASKHSMSVPIYTSVEEAITATSANLVFDVTIPATHREITLSSMKLGCDVMGEKPMATAIADAREMVAAASSSGRIYSVMQNRRYNERIRRFRNIISSGVIGEVGIVKADFFLGPHFGGFRELMENPLILDMAIHTFDQARFIAGTDAVSVYAHEFNPAGSWYKGNAATTCIFEFSNGAVFTYTGSWCAEGAPTSWESDWRVVGSKGTAMWDGEHEPYAETVANPDGKDLLHVFNRSQPAFSWKGQEGHAGCLDEMFSALIESRPAETDSGDNIKTVEMVFAAIESARTGKKILF